MIISGPKEGTIMCASSCAMFINTTLVSQKGNAAMYKYGSTDNCSLTQCLSLSCWQHYEAWWGKQRWHQANNLQIYSLTEVINKTNLSSYANGMCWELFLITLLSSSVCLCWNNRPKGGNKPKWEHKNLKKAKYLVYSENLKRRQYLLKELSFFVTLL